MNENLSKPNPEKETAESYLKRLAVFEQHIPFLLAAIVESSDDAILSKTLDGIITSWNAGAERLFGWPAQMAIGKHITLIVPEDRRTEEENVLARLSGGERIDHFETVRVAQDGRLIDVSGQVPAALDNQAGDTLGGEPIDVISGIAR